jgi:hypothetical protein
MLMRGNSFPHAVHVSMLGFGAGRATAIPRFGAMRRPSAVRVQGLSIRIRAIWLLIACDHARVSLATRSGAWNSFENRAGEREFTMGRYNMDALQDWGIAAGTIALFIASALLLVLLEARDHCES